MFSILELFGTVEKNAEKTTESCATNCQDSNWIACNVREIGNAGN